MIFTENFEMAISSSLTPMTIAYMRRKDGSFVGALAGPTLMNVSIVL